MDKLVILCSFMNTLLAFLLIAFAVFVIGFLIGYKHEEKRIFKAKKSDEFETQETEEEKKSKREWKNFLKYDGSTLESNKEI